MKDAVFTIFEVKVKTGAKISKTENFQFNDEGKISLKAFVKSQPENGKVNKELIKIFSKTLNLPQNFFKIISGHSNSNKIIKLTGIDNRNYDLFSKR